MLFQERCSRNTIQIFHGFGPSFFWSLLYRCEKAVLVTSERIRSCDMISQLTECDENPKKFVDLAKACIQGLCFAFVKKNSDEAKDYP
mmetsp:Transcript_1182/g.1508  ORF Transcript_1182/g.1508 Transcript_1182/m.1508 type:complete len:88 (-) Transcript_1182:213-476(-)